MPQNIRIATETLGCKLNQAESETLARQLASAGFCMVPPETQQDVYILNTCTVTHIADRKSRHLLRMAKRRNPQVLTVATGCYAERMAQSLAAALEIDLVLGNDDKLRLPEILIDQFSLVGSCKQILIPNRTRALIKVQDGCNRWCSYCIVPMVRGREKSVAVNEVLSEIRQRVDEGYREVVLTGTEIGAYSADGLDIKGLLQQILADTVIERLRVSSLQPYEITPELLELWRDQRLCRHFHISLQSGADSVLSRMRRGYTINSYQNALTLINVNLPDAAVTTDVIVGFPCETEEEFCQTVDFCRRADFSRIHVFPYSSRPGTDAASMQGQVPTDVKKERMCRMLALAKEEARSFHSRFIGRDLPVLWEQSHNGVWSGYAPQYIRVYAEGTDDLTNTIGSVRLLRAYKGGLLGEIYRQGSIVVQQ
ncbi:MAG: tRNA (N(6)-L-threonylcarbamoyladenosine(37)-C(2))-methylthiotransferase MtaB [Dehalococcoidia bacterium]|nr:tRNA (N(6)-L-threonylcarbamoyladenosine(37)-C(2))-methylthiotransferase MtaB [Dehalococcoidia bacterium]